jgi:hypothetical protein
MSHKGKDLRLKIIAKAKDEAMRSRPPRQRQLQEQIFDLFWNRVNGGVPPSTDAEKQKNWKRL